MMEYGTIGTKPSPLLICTLQYLLHSGLELGEGEFILELLIACDTHAGSLFGVSEEKFHPVCQCIGIPFLHYETIHTIINDSRHTTLSGRDTRDSMLPRFKKVKRKTLIIIIRWEDKNIRIIKEYILVLIILLSVEIGQS